MWDTLQCGAHCLINLKMQLIINLPSILMNWCVSHAMGIQKLPPLNLLLRYTQHANLPLFSRRKIFNELKLNLDILMKKELKLIVNNLTL